MPEFPKPGSKEAAGGRVDMGSAHVEAGLGSVGEPGIWKGQSWQPPWGWLARLTRSLKLDSVALQHLRQSGKPRSKPLFSPVWSRPRPLALQRLQTPP